MNRYWSPFVARLRPYTPGEQRPGVGAVKLNTNENPYGPSPKVLDAIAAEAKNLNLYPDPTAKGLREAIGHTFGLGPDHVFVGNGSDEVLAHAFHALLEHDGPVLFPDVSYSFYPTYCALYGLPYREVPVGDAFEIDVDDYAPPAGGIVIANPNAPTGRALPLDHIARLVEAHRDVVVLIDEAYVDFGGESAAPLVGRFANLLVVQTLSKSRALAGLRVGFALGHPELLSALERVKDSFNSYPVGRLAIAGARAAMEDQAWFNETRQRVIRTREQLTIGLQTLGFSVVPSAANFVFARHPSVEGMVLADELRRRNILVRRFPLARIKDHLRITVGTDAQCENLINALGDILRVD
jgi:histidinol-phosphate aminotransferase